MTDVFVRQLFHFYLGQLLDSESSSLQPSFLLSARSEKRGQRARYKAGRRARLRGSRPVPGAGKLAWPLLCRDPPLRCSTGTQAWGRPPLRPLFPCGLGMLQLCPRPPLFSLPSQVSRPPALRLSAHQPAPTVALGSYCASSHS